VCVEMCIIQAVNSNLKMKVASENRAILLLSSVPTIMFATSPNFSKQDPIGLPYNDYQISRKLNINLYDGD